MKKRQALIADSDATRREREADARAAPCPRKNSSGESPAGCVRRRAGRRAARRQSHLEADILVKAEIEKRQKEITAEAEASSCAGERAARPTPSSRRWRPKAEACRKC